LVILFDEATYGLIKKPPKGAWWD